MTGFIIAAAVLVAAVLAALLRPLLRPLPRRGAPQASATVQGTNAQVYAEQLAELNADLKSGTLTQEQWTEARTELARRALEEQSAAAPAAQPTRAPRAAFAVAIALPVAAAVLYAWLGTPAALSPAPPPEAARQITPDQINAMVERLAARLKDNPQDAQGWMMLGRSYAVLGRYDDAAKAYGKAADLQPSDARVLADYADSLAMANGKTLVGQPEQVVKRALKADPDNLKALLLAGTAAFERKSYAEAIRHWEKAVGLMPQDSEIKQSIQSGIEEARKRLK